MCCRSSVVLPVVHGMLLNPLSFEGYNSPTAGAYAASFALSPSAALSPASSPLTVDTSDNSPAITAVRFVSSPSTPPLSPLPPNSAADLLIEQEQSGSSSTVSSALLHSSSDDQLPQPTKADGNSVPVTWPSTPARSLGVRPRSSLLSASIVERLLTARRVCEQSISTAQSIHDAGVKRQTRQTQLALVKSNHAFQLISAECEQLQSELAEKRAAQAKYRENKATIEQADALLLALLNKRRQAIQQEQSAIAAKANSLFTRAGRLLPAVDKLSQQVLDEVAYIRGEVMAHYEAKQKQQEEEARELERKLREAYDGQRTIHTHTRTLNASTVSKALLLAVFLHCVTLSHMCVLLGHLPKPVEVDSEQLPCWGEPKADWDKPERCIRYIARLVDLGAAAAAASSASPSSSMRLPFRSPTSSSSSADTGVVGPFRLEFVPTQRIVRMKHQPFGEGAMRLAYYCEDITDCPLNDYRNAIRLVAKESRWSGMFEGQRENRREFYTGDMMAQLIGQRLVECFNSTDPPKLVQMLTPMLYHFRERRDTDREYMHMEVCLSEQGEFQRYTNNESFLIHYYSSMMALSHWTHHFTNGSFLLCDLQGVGYLLTDPQIHSRQHSDEYGQGDLGVSGMESFFKEHFCNDICRRLKLTPHPLSPATPPEDYTDGKTKASERYDSDVVGVCGHVYKLSVKDRKTWKKNGQRQLCPQCTAAGLDPNSAFFAVRAS